jgi:hypothetical protein
MQSSAFTPLDSRLVLSYDEREGRIRSAERVEAQPSLSPISETPFARIMRTPGTWKGFRSYNFRIVPISATLAIRPRISLVLAPRQRLPTLNCESPDSTVSQGVDLAQVWQEVAALMQVVAGENAPEPTPSAEECRFCHVPKSMCPARIEPLEVSVTDF